MRESDPRHIKGWDSALRRRSGNSAFGAIHCTSSVEPHTPLASRTEESGKSGRPSDPRPDVADKQNTQRQHDALDPICLKVFEEKISGKLNTDDRPALLEALSHIRDGDMLTVQEVDRLGRNLLEGLIVLNDLFQRGIAVKVLDGIAAGEHTERSLILDLALALAEDRRRDIVRKIKNGLDAARRRGRIGGRRPVVDDDKRAAILARRQRGESIRTIAARVKVSVGVVHKTLTEAQPEAQRDQ